MHFGAYFGKTDVIEYCIKSGFDINAQNNDVFEYLLAENFLTFRKREKQHFMWQLQKNSKRSSVNSLIIKLTS